MANIEAPDLPKHYHVPTRKLSAVQEHHMLRCYLCRLCGAHQPNAAIMDEFLYIYAFELGLTVASTQRICPDGNDNAARPAKRMKCAFTRTNAVTGVNILDPCAIGACAYLRRGTRARSTGKRNDVLWLLEQRLPPVPDESSEENLQDGFVDVPSYPLMESEDSGEEYFSDDSNRMGVMYHQPHKLK